MMRSFFIVVLIALLPLSGFAQFKSQAKPPALKEILSQPASVAGRGFSILGLDPSRLKMQQAYEMSYFSIGGRGFTQGLYLNTLSYQFSIPLTMQLQWGIVHQPFGGLRSSAPFLNSGPFISAAKLRYQPKKNMLFEINFQNVPYPYGLRDRWGEW